MLLHVLPMCIDIMQAENGATEEIEKEHLAIAPLQPANEAQQRARCSLAAVEKDGCRAIDDFHLFAAGSAGPA